MSRFLLKDNSVYFLVFSTYKKIPLFISNKISLILIENICFYQKKYQFELIAYSIIPCHLNLYIRFSKKEDIESFERDFKSYTNKCIIKLLEKNEVDDYHFICHRHCYCNKYPFHEDNPGALHPGLSASPEEPSQTAGLSKKSAIPGCGAPGPCLFHPLTDETINIIMNKKRVWRHKSWKNIVDNQSIFIKKLNYIYNNYKKHKMDFILKRCCKIEYRRHL